MQYSTFSTDGLHGGVVIRESAKTLSAIVSTDIHAENSKKHAALACMYPDMLLSGAGKYSRSEFLEAVNLLGASIDVRVVHGVVTFSFRSTADVAPKLLKLFSTMLQNPTFAVKELDRVKKQTINELFEHEENAKAIGHEQFKNHLYGLKDRRYTFAPKEIRKAVSTITTKDIQSFHKSILHTRATATFGSNSTVATYTQKTLARLWRTADSSTEGVHKPKEALAATTLTDIPSKQNIEFSIGGPLPITLHHPDYLPFVFGLAVLGKVGGFAGRLMSTVREKEGLTYGIYANTETVRGNETGYWRIMTFFAPEQAKKGLSSTQREIKLIHEKGITKSEWERFRTILHTQEVMLNDSLQKTVMELHGYLVSGFSIAEMEAYKARLQAVSRTEVNAALKKYLHPKKLIISGAGPIEKMK